MAEKRVVVVNHPDTENYAFYIYTEELDGIVRVKEINIVLDQEFTVDQLERSLATLEALADHFTPEEYHWRRIKYERALKFLEDSEDE